MSTLMILDASALIAFIYKEKGMDFVEKYLANSEISTINLAEVAAYMVKQGVAIKEASMLLQDLSIPSVHFDEMQAFTTAQLVEKTAAKGLSLGDRACLALAIQRNCPVLTADKAWVSLNLKIKIELIR